MGRQAKMLMGVGMATFALLGIGLTSQFASGEVPNSVVTSASSVLWSLTLALVGWKTSEKKPAYARTNSR
jgi:hypothetical protein